MLSLLPTNISPTLQKGSFLVESSLRMKPLPCFFPLPLCLSVCFHSSLRSTELACIVPTGNTSSCKVASHLELVTID